MNNRKAMLSGGPYVNGSGQTKMVGGNYQFYYFLDSYDAGRSMFPTVASSLAPAISITPRRYPVTVRTRHRITEWATSASLPTTGPR